MNWAKVIGPREAIKLRILSSIVFSEGLGIRVILDSSDQKMAFRTLAREILEGFPMAECTFCIDDLT